MPLEKMEERRDDAMYGKEGAVAVCQRCYRLSHYGAIEKHLRVDVRETDEKDKKDKKSKGELSPAKFREVLERLQKLNAVVVYLVDIFDFHGTFIRGLRDIIGKKNPVLVGVNKIDLLPKDYKQNRVENWIKDECQAMGLRDIAGINLISSARGTGVSLLLADALKLAKKKRADIYIVGAANVGKSSFINQLMRLQTRGKKRDGGALTTSVVPGTTLDVVRIPLGGGVCLYDTPGLMMPHQLTNYLDAKELRSVLPTKNVERVSLRLGEGKAMFVGGLARLEVVEGKPFFFTTFFSPSVKVHPGRVEDAEAFTRKHVGGLLAPPFTEEGFDNLGEWTSKSFSASGEGWRRSCLDVVLSGLGWIAITGVGDIKLRVCVPRGVGVFTREPLMPFETQQGVSSYTGTQLVNRRQMKKTARRRRGPR